MKYSVITCPTCKGNGKVMPTKEYTEEPSESFEMRICPMCDGQRLIEVSPYINGK